MSYEGRKSEIVNMEIGRLREATQLINSVMASLNLPAAIEDLSGQYLVHALSEEDILDVVRSIDFVILMPMAAATKYVGSIRLYTFSIKM